MLNLASGNTVNGIMVAQLMSNPDGYPNVTVSLVIMTVIQPAKYR